MLSKVLLATGASLAVLLCLNLPASAADDVIQRGGPYQSKSNTIQTFNSLLYVDDAKIDQAMSLNVTNGGGGARGFSWVRMWLTDGSNSPRGRMIVNENSFRTKSSIDIPLSGALNRGNKGIFIQAAGVPGATVTWTLKGGSGGASAGGAASGGAAAGGLSISGLEPSVFMAGADGVINGSGFGSNKSAVSVVVSQKYRSPVTLSVSQVTPTAVKVSIPKEINAGKETITMTIGKGSATSPVDLLGTPEILGCNFTGGPVGTQFVFTVKNMAGAGTDVKCSMSLSGDPKDKDNVSVAGNVTKVKDVETMTLTMPSFPVLGDSPFFNPPKAISVFTRINGLDVKPSPYTIYCGRAPW